METKKRGRKAGVGTLEAREYVNTGKLRQLLAKEEGLNEEAKARLMKAVKFGLGIKEKELKNE